jgi:hypothetical protein
MHKDFIAPDGLSELGKAAIEIIFKCSSRYLEGEISGGGCKAFYSPDEWKERGEQYGKGCVLIVCHDGGDLAPFFSHDYECYSLMEKMADALSKHGIYAEQCTSWYTAIYKI